MSERSPRTDSKPTRVRQRENSDAFATVLDRYIRSRYECPLIRNGLAMLDKSNPIARIGWTANVAIFNADVELAIEKALSDSPALMTKLFDWFIAPEILRGCDLPKLTLDESRQHSAIQQRCGKEFIRRSIFPLRRYFTKWRKGHTEAA